MKSQSFKDLIAWKKSIILVKEVYAYTELLPQSEQFGLCSQMQRAAVAIPSNLAEGYGRQHRKEFLQFISIANGSACELETQLIICNEVNKLKVGNVDDLLSMVDEIKKILYALTRGLK